jgi:hypothetical protein
LFFFQTLDVANAKKVAGSAFFFKKKVKGGENASLAFDLSALSIGKHAAVAQGDAQFGVF